LTTIIEWVVNINITFVKDYSNKLILYYYYIFYGF